MAFCGGNIILDFKRFANKDKKTLEFAAFVNEDEFWEAVWDKKVGKH